MKKKVECIFEGDIFKLKMKNGKRFEVIALSRILNIDEFSSEEYIVFQINGTRCIIHILKQDIVSINLVNLESPLFDLKQKMKFIFKGVKKYFCR